MSFGSQLRKAREAKWMTARELAAEIGVDVQMIARYESDKSQPKLYTAIDIADALGVSLDYLCERGHKLELWVY